MKILFVHNRYQLPGGEDEVYRRERDLLIEHGHEVLEYNRDNREIADYDTGKKASLAFRTVWAWDSYREIKNLIRRESPNVAHFHNIFPLISPSAYYACATAKVPVVQTLHNSRLMCPAATLFRKGGLCEDCSNKLLAWPGVWHACYQESRARTATVSCMSAAHRLIGTWSRKVDTYIVSTEFYRQKFIAAGLPPERLFVKPHFVARDPGVTLRVGAYGLFIGRLAPEKGVLTLLEAWRGLGDVPLYIRGEGPLTQKVKEFAEEMRQVKIVERASRSELFDLIKSASFLVWPSEGYYETFGLVAIEAFACGVPVLASRIGVMAELVTDGRTGLHFNPGDPNDLAAKIRWAWEHPEDMRQLGRNARTEYEQKYTAERNFGILAGAYERAFRGAIKGQVPNQEAVSS